MTDSADWLIFCETDRNRLLAEATRRRGYPVARPADALDDVIEDVLGVGLVTRPLLGRVLGLCQYDQLRILINSRMPDLVLPNTDLEGLTHSTKAHELAHLRLPHHEAEVRAAQLRGETLSAEVDARHEEEANFYAGVFLVPTADLWAMPGVAALLAAQAESHRMASEALWALAAELARAFRVTGSLMARRLGHLGLVEKTDDRILRLAPLPIAI